MSTPSLPANFDPRLVPVVETDEQLPQVAQERCSAVALRQRLAVPPAWRPEVVREPRFTNRAVTSAAVLLPIVLRDQPTVLLTERTAHLSTHSGQVAFPGGKVDPQDADAAAAALREAQEEVGLEPHWVEVIGQLPLYVTGTMFHVTPVVALVQPGFTLRPNAQEVAAVFEVPLAFLLNPANHRRHQVLWQTPSGPEKREWFSMPYQDGEHERYIWGATAGMLRNFYRLMLA